MTTDVAGFERSLDRNGALPPPAGSVGANPDVLAQPARNRPVGVPVSPRRPRNTLWVIAGLLLIVVSGLSALIIAQSLSSRVGVLVSTRDIAKGEVVSDNDLGVASIAATTGVRAIAPADRTKLVGQVATGPIGRGSIVHPAQFVDSATEDGPKVIVGASLDPGQYPRVGLVPGDQVVIVEVSSQNPTLDDTATGPRELARGEVVEVTKLARSDGLLISMRVNESAAVPISERAEQGRLRLALIDNGTPDKVKPLDPAQPVKPGQPDQPGQ